MQHQGQILTTAQKQIISPQLYQQMDIIAMPIQDLHDRIKEEVQSNPALKCSRKKSHDDIIAATVSRPETLQEHLLFQLHVQKTDPRIIEAGELLIQNLDENGFNIEKPETVVKDLPPEIISRAAKLISTLDPPGTCTDGYRESLEVQASLREDAPPHTIDILKNHFEDLGKKKYREIAQSLKISEAKVLEILEFIRKLSPYPGANFSQDQPHYIIPALKITSGKEGIEIFLLDDTIPSLRINSSFEKQGEKNPEAKKFVTEKVREAKAFISLVENRNNTLLRTASAIVNRQQDFFMNGPKSLAPLTQHDIAADMGVSDSTVSRVTSKNYVQTDWGIFLMSYFFTSNISENLSKESVKFRIHDIIEQNKEGKKLSDQKISDILNGQGINISRRTVAKYRKELDIASSFQR